VILISRWIYWELLNWVFRLRFDYDLDDRACFQRDRFASGIDQNVSYTNFLIRIVSALNGNLHFLGFASNGFNDFLHGARQTASYVIMHALRPLQLNIILFSGTVLSNNDQPAILQLGARFCGSAWGCVCREARDETIAVDGSLNEAAKSYVRAIALVTNERGDGSKHGSH
jgi:hypothetical protein